MTEQIKIRKGPRDVSFKNMIIDILKLGQLTDDTISIILDKEGMKFYNWVFTHKTANERKNYELFEFIGDRTVNKCIAWYIFKRFPQLHSPEYIQNMSKLVNKLKSTESLAQFTLQNFDFWKYVTCDEETYTTNRNKTLEDVFEAFFGLTEYLLDEKVKEGCGYIITYKIMEHILDKTDIQIDTESVTDNKTKLKELMERPNCMKGIRYETKRENDKFHVKTFLLDKAGLKFSQNLYEEIGGEEYKDKGLYKNILQMCLEQPDIVKECLKLTENIDHKPKIIGKASAFRLKDAQQEAASKALGYLNRNKFLLK